MILSLFLFIGAKGQYVIDFSDPATYQVNCGQVVSSQWTVKDQTCELSLPPMVLNSTSSLNIYFSIKINQSGNLETSDELMIMHKVNENGSWIIDTIVQGTNTNNVRLINDSISISSADTIYFKALAHTNASNEFWAIKSGDISISNVTPLYFPLPIELLSFEADYNEDFSIIDINWATLTETNNDYFTIERSYNGLDFEIITIVNGAGNSNNVLNYEYSDLSTSDKPTYYRLRQTDFDGKTTVTKPLGVTPDNNNSTPELSAVNADNGEILLSIFIPEDQNVSIEIIDMAGRVIITDSRFLPSGSHVLNYNAGSDLNGKIIFVRILNQYSDKVNKKILINT